MPVRLQLGEYVAEVLQLSDQDIRWYYLISPKHARKIIAIHGCDSYDQATEAATRALAALNRAPAGE